MASSNPTGIEMTMVIYHSANTAKHSVYGSERLFGGRVFNYGMRKGGDHFNVANADIIANLDKYRAYPCNEEFTVKGGKLINPCGKMDSVEKVGGNLEDIPGVGPRVAQRLIDAGLDTQEKVANQLTEEVMGDLSLPPASRSKIKEWQESQD